MIDALARAARDGWTHYPDPRGVAALREAIVEKLARENGVIAHPDDLTVTAGGTHGLFLSLQALLSPGDEILVLSPYWMAIPQLVGFAPGATLRAVPAYLALADGTGSVASFAASLREAIGPNTRGIYVNTPNNPTGVVLDRAQLQAVADVAIERDLWVISYEAYEHMLFDGAAHVSLASLPGMAERTVSVWTLSKSYAMTGWRLGYVLAPPALRAVLAPVLAFYSTNGVFPAAQMAAREAITGPQDCVATMRAAYDERRRLLAAGLANAPGVKFDMPRGAFYAFPDVGGLLAGGDVWALAEAWLAMGVAALPGTAFGPGYETRMRMSLATRSEDVAEAARRIAAFAAAGARA